MAKKVLLPQEESADETRQALALAQSQGTEVYMQIHKQMLDIYPATHGKMANGGDALTIIEGITGVGTSTFATRMMLITFSSLSATCGYLQQLTDDGQVSSDTAIIQTTAIFLIALIPYVRFGCFLDRRDIWQSRLPESQCQEQDCSNLVNLNYNALRPRVSHFQVACL